MAALGNPTNAAAALDLPTNAAANGSKGMVNMEPAADAEDSSAAQDKWSRARGAIMPSVALSRSLKTLRDMCGEDAVIDPSCLTRIKTLGEGAFASVDLSWYQSPGSSKRMQVAVKRLKPELYKVEDLQLFAKEVELMRKLSHRNIVDMVGVVDGCDCSVVQEFMSGGTLKQLVTRQMLSNGGRVYNLHDGLDICLQIARGLRYLHNCSPMVIHRDLKLENVLLNIHSKKPAAAGSRFEAKLADFGLSKRVEVQQQAMALRRTASGNAARHTQLGNGSSQCDMDAVWSKKAQQGTYVGPRPKGKGLLQGAARDHGFNLTGRTGSLMYMSPEVFREQPYSEKADVFSYSMMMYEVMHRYIMLSAISVLGTYEELEEYAARVASGYRPPLHDNLPASITSIIQDCWSGDPLSRPSMDAVVTRLEAAAAAGELQGLDKPAGCACTIC